MPARDEDILAQTKNVGTADSDQNKWFRLKYAHPTISDLSFLTGREIKLDALLQLQTAANLQKH